MIVVVPGLVVMNPGGVITAVHHVIAVKFPAQLVLWCQFRNDRLNPDFVVLFA